MKLDLKTKKGRLILAGGLLATAVATTAVAVPVALLVPGSGSSSTPDVDKTGLSAADQQEIATFNRKYNDAISVVPVTGGARITVKEGAFVNRTDLPVGFTLPSAVTDIAANAFKGAKLPRGFMIPNGVTSIDPTAFAEVVFDEAYYWDESEAKAGAKVDVVENNTEWKSFNEAYPGTLDGKATKECAFASKTDFKFGFTLPSFLTRIGPSSFSKAVLPAGFTLPQSITYIDAAAFYQADLPTGFRLPERMQSLDMPTDNTTSDLLSFWLAGLKSDFRLPSGLKEISSKAFLDAVVPPGFAIPAGTKIWVSHIGKNSVATWTTSPDNTLNVVLPDGYKWSDPRGAVAGSVVVHDTTSQAEVDSFASQLTSFTSTSLTETDFKAYVKTGAYDQSADSAALGFALPALPSGLTANISKPAGSAVVFFVVAKNGKTANAVSTITHFAAEPVSQDTTEVNNLLALLKTLDATHLSETAFQEKAFTAQNFTQAIADQLEIGPLPSFNGVSLYMSKKNGLDTIALTGVKGNSGQINDHIEVTRFATPYPASGAQRDVDATLARFRAINATTLTSAGFNALVITGRPFVQSVADQLGIGPLPHLNDGVNINMNKSSAGDWIEIQGIKGSYVSPVERLTITNYGVNAAERYVRSVLDTLRFDATSLSQTDFSHLAVPNGPFTQAMATRLGIGAIPKWDATQITINAAKQAGSASVSISGLSGGKEVDTVRAVTKFNANTKILLLIGGGQSNNGLVVDSAAYPSSKWPAYTPPKTPLWLANSKGVFEEPVNIGGSYNIAVPYKLDGFATFQHAAYVAANTLDYKAVYGVSASHGAAGWAPPDARNLSSFNISPRGQYFQIKEIYDWLAKGPAPFDITDTENVDVRYVHIQGEADAGWAGANAENAKTHQYLTLSQVYGMQELLRRYDMVAALGTMKEKWVATGKQAQVVQAEIRASESYDRVAVADNANVGAPDDDIYGIIHYGPNHQMGEVGANLIAATGSALGEPMPTQPIAAVPDGGYVLLDISKSSTLGKIKDTTFVYLAYRRETGVVSNLRDAFLYRQYDSQGNAVYRLKYEFSDASGKKLTVVTEQAINPLMNLWDKTNAIAAFKVISVDDQTGQGFTAANIAISAFRNANESTAYGFSAGDINSDSFQLFRTDANSTVQGVAKSTDGKSFNYSAAKVSVVKI